jgi:HK97 family phage major capsid protein
MSMTMAEGRSECKRLFDECAEILSRHGGRITEDTPNDERKKIDDNMAEINGLEIKLGRLKLDDEDSERIARGVRDYGAPADPAPGGFEHRAVSLGRYVTGRPEYRSSIQPGGALTGQRPYLAVATPPELSLVDLAIRTARGRKALVTSGATSGGAISINDRLPGITSLAQSGTDFLDILPTLQTTSDVVEWVQQTARTNGAAPVAEATATTGASGLKPESAITFAVQNKPVETIATWIPVTTRTLADAPMLRSAIDDELLYMIRVGRDQAHARELGDGLARRLHHGLAEPGRADDDLRARPDVRPAAPGQHGVRLERDGDHARARRARGRHRHDGLGERRLPAQHRPAAGGASGAPDCSSAIGYLQT